MKQELSYVQGGFRKGRGTRDQIANIHWIIEKAREFQKTSTSASLIMPKLLIVWIKITCGKFLKDMGIPDHLTCLLRNLYASQEATVRTLCGTINWFKIEEGIRQGRLLSPCLFNLHAEHIMRNARLGELQAGIKIGGRNINNLRYVDDTTLMEKREEELKSLLMRVKEERERAGLKLNIKNRQTKNCDHGIWPHYFMANRWGKGGRCDRVLLLGL